MVRRPLLYLVLLIKIIFSQYPEVPGEILFLQSDWKGQPSFVFDSEFNIYQYAGNRFDKKDRLPIESDFKSHQCNNTLILADESNIGLASGSNWVDYTALITPLCSLDEIVDVSCRNKNHWSVLTGSSLFVYSNGQLLRQLLPVSNSEFLGHGLLSENRYFAYTENELYYFESGKWKLQTRFEEEIIKINALGDTLYIHTDEKLVIYRAGGSTTLLQDEVRTGFIVFDKLYSVMNNDFLYVFDGASLVEKIDYDKTITGMTNGTSGRLLVIADDQISSLNVQFLYPYYENWLLSELNKAEIEYRLQDYEDILEASLKDFYIDTDNFQIVVRKNAEDLFWKNKFDSSIQMLNKLSSLSPDGLQILSENYIQIGEYDKASIALLQKFKLTNDSQTLVNAFYSSFKSKDVTLQNDIVENLLNSENQSLKNLGIVYKNFLQAIQYAVKNDSLILECQPGHVRAELFSLRHYGINRQWLYRQLKNFDYSESILENQMDFVGGYQKELYFMDSQMLYDISDYSKIHHQLSQGDLLKKILITKNGEVWRHVETSKYHLLQKPENGKWITPKNCRFRKSNFTGFVVNSSFYGLSGNRLYRFAQGSREKIIDIPIELSRNIINAQLIIDSNDFIAIVTNKSIEWYDKRSRNWESSAHELLFDNQNIKSEKDYFNIGNKLFKTRKATNSGLEMIEINEASDFSVGNIWGFSLLRNQLNIYNREEEPVRLNLFNWSDEKNWSNLYLENDNSIFFVNSVKTGHLLFDENLFNYAYILKSYSVSDHNSTGQRLPDILSVAGDLNLSYLITDEAELLDDAYKSIRSGQYKSAVETLTALKISTTQTDWIDLTYYLSVLDGLRVEKQYIDAISWLSRIWQWFPAEKKVEWFDPLWTDIILKGDDKETLLLVDFIHRQAKQHPEMSPKLVQIANNINHIVFTQGKKKIQEKIQALNRKAKKKIVLPMTNSGKSFKRM